MNDTPNPNAEQHETQAQAPGAVPPSQESSPKPESCVLASLCAGLDRGVNEAKSAAEKAVPKVRKAASDAVYWLGYGVSFAAAFSLIVAKEVAPAALKAGCRNGAQAGTKEGERFVAGCSHREDNRAPDLSEEAARPIAPETQPGMA